MKEAKKKIHVEEPVEPYTSKAKALANNFDPDDYPFIALALQLDIPIWTNDKELIRHSLQSNKYIALDTTAIEELLIGKTIESIYRHLKKRYIEKP